MVASELKTVTLKVNGADVTGKNRVFLCFFVKSILNAIVVLSVSTSDVGPSTSLGRFLRDRLHLTGTKISCAQGGCGACVVVAEFPDADGKPLSRSVNACLIPLMTCGGWSVTTVEGLGSTREGLSAEQDRLSRFHGTQCGYCTPGMVMTMHGLRRRKDEPTLGEVEEVLDGNLCRCTGYRPIFDAWKTFAPDAPDELKKKVGIRTHS